MKQTLKLLAQIAALALFCKACAWFAVFAKLPVPANILGIVVLVALLCCGVVKEKHIEEGASFLLRHMMFFFIPIAAGLMDWGGVFARHALTLGAAVAVSTMLALLCVGYFVRLLRKDTEGKDV